MITCPYCGSSRLKEKGGENGNPFNRRLRKTICLECGRTVSEDETLLDMIDFTVYIEMTAKGGGITRTETAEFPYENGKCSLSEFNYPICRFKQATIYGDTIDIDGEIVISITDEPYITTKNYTVYAVDKHPEHETIEIKIYSKIN